MVFCNPTKLWSLSLVPQLTSMLSTIALLSFLLRVTRKKDYLRRIYHRLFFGMSIVDLIRSVNFFVGTFLVSKDKIKDYPWARGNCVTCYMQGFISQLGLAVPLYGTAICVYAYYSIKHNFKAEKIQSIEKWLHGASICIPVFLAILLFIVLPPEPLGSWCWLPASSEHELMLVSPLLLIFSFLIGIAMVILSLVTEHKKRTKRRSWKGKKQLFEAARSKKAQRLIIRVVLHLIVIIISNLFIIIFQFSEVNCACLLLGNIFISLSGFFNVIVYTKLRSPSVSDEHTCQISIRHISQRDIPIVTNGFDPPTTISTTFGNVFVLTGEERDAEAFQIFTGDSDEECQSANENSLASCVESASDGVESFQSDRNSSQSVSLTKGWPVFRIS